MNSLLLLLLLQQPIRKSINSFRFNAQIQYKAWHIKKLLVPTIMISLVVEVFPIKERHSFPRIIQFDNLLLRQTSHGLCV